jgi:predicted ABC-type transport system involved in lysophospholipase L1 biosynthesis ATPase subunit
MLELVGLADRLKHHRVNFRGQQQRVALPARWLESARHSDGRRADRKLGYEDQPRCDHLVRRLNEERN